MTDYLELLNISRRNHMCSSTLYRLSESSENSWEMKKISEAGLPRISLIWQSLWTTKITRQHILA